ncbi:phytanoyl-CoA dioxygenase family protein [Nostoc sp. WHI]|uniref:phytanoyl-CoA dioxygenase family protein n=1 Tax=Nostoc sp. WHI TaxID=2650611 RepID=UPI0018C73A1A|nr:phytanoyl-CoA dioxygenase family protein [Nostoc sp. WHI]MBG1266527.1 phytanoyl-CoA dioxygenase [Nostoc sp. WHI]
MKLTKEQMEVYDEQGMLFIPECLCQREVEKMNAALLPLVKEDTPGRVLENNKKTVRALHGCHTTSEIFQRLILHPSLLEPAKQILASEVYVYQFKVNFKAAFEGDLWPWHQDFVFWDKEDGMLWPRALNIVVFLDEVNEFNGPLYFIPGSHKQSYTHLQTPPQQTTSNGEKNEWMDSFVANLKYTIDKPTITKLVNNHHIVAPKGPSGSVLFFHCNLVHGSVSNISPYDRKVAIITYNSLENIPHFNSEPRPEFLVSRDYTPLQPLARDFEK